MDAPCRALNPALLVLLLLSGLPGSLVAQVNSPSHPVAERKGVWFTGGLGAAGGEGGFGGFSGNLALGWTVNPKVLLGVGSTFVRGPADRTNVTFGTLDLRTQYYPESYAGLFLNAGLGLGFFRMDDSGSGPNVGAGVEIGMGYDIGLVRNVSVTPWFNWFHFHTPDPRGSAVGIGLALSVH
jgi:hypothetical protein